MSGRVAYLKIRCPVCRLFGGISEQRRAKGVALQASLPQGLHRQVAQKEQVLRHLQGQDRPRHSQPRVTDDALDCQLLSFSLVHHILTNRPCLNLFISFSLV